MTSNKFDQEIEKLYQQRKQQIVAPAVDLTKLSNKPPRQRSLVNMLFLLLSGGVVSFGIMAIVSHLAKSPVHGNDDKLKQHSVNIVDIMVSNRKEEKAIVINPLTTKKTLPEKKTLPLKPESSRPEQTKINNISPDLSPTTRVAHKLEVPNVDIPQFAIEPTHKVLPEYPRSALYRRKSGMIKLQYTVTENGEVIDIVSLNKHSDRNLVRSASKALAQWRYPENRGNKRVLEVEFSFNLDE